VEAVVEGLALIEGVLRGIDGFEEFDQDFAGLDAEPAFFHDAMSSGTSDGDDGHSPPDGHDRSSLLEFLQAAVRATRAFRINQKGLASAKGFGCFFEAGDCGFAIEAIHGNEMGQMEGLAYNGPFKERALQENGDAAGNGADDGGSVRGAGVIRGENAGARGDTIESLDAHTHADAANEEHNASYAAPVKWINVLGDKGVDEQRRASNEDVEGEENAHEGGAEHGRVIRYKFSVLSKARVSDCGR
jgi:hypothetical protein